MKDMITLVVCPGKGLQDEFLCEIAENPVVGRILWLDTGGQPPPLEAWGAVQAGGV